MGDIISGEAAPEDQQAAQPAGAGTVEQQAAAKEVSQQEESKTSRGAASEAEANADNVTPEPEQTAEDSSKCESQAAAELAGQLSAAKLAADSSAAPECGERTVPAVPTPPSTQTPVDSEGEQGTTADAGADASTPPSTQTPVDSEGEGNGSTDVAETPSGPPVPPPLGPPPRVPQAAEVPVKAPSKAPKGVAAARAPQSPEKAPPKDPASFDGTELDENPDPEKIRDSLRFFPQFYSPMECTNIEAWIDDTALLGENGMLPGTRTVDHTPSRSKYFFGYGYTYGRGMRGREELLPHGSVAAIPDWIRSCVIAPLEMRGIVPFGWIDSVVLNDYRTGSSIVGHVDPPRLFARPIITVTFFCEAKLVFGASFDPQRTVPPAYSQHLSRGSMLMLDGYSANAVTHGIRPEDMMGHRRVSMILRHVICKETAPPMPTSHAQSTLSLICKAQGLWRTMPGCIPKRFFVIRGTTVTVLNDERDGDQVLKTTHALSDEELMKHPNKAAVWQLQPTEGGIICNGGLLTHDFACRDNLCWQLIAALHGTQMTPEEVASSRYTWLRAQN